MSMPSKTYCRSLSCKINVPYCFSVFVNTLTVRKGFEKVKWPPRRSGGNSFFVVCSLLEVCVNFSPVASTVVTPAYQRMTASIQRTAASNSNLVQTVGHVASEVSGVAATVAPVVGLLGGIIDIFA
jgi:hypothetical protein